MIRYLICFWLVCPFAIAAPGPSSLRFEVTIPKSLEATPKDGRLFVILSLTNNPAPRFLLGNAGPDAPLAFARDMKGFGSGGRAIFDEKAFAFPITNLSAVPFASRAGRITYHIQALFDSATDLRMPNGPGNLFSLSNQIQLDLSSRPPINHELDRQIPSDELPPNTPQFKFVRLQSKLLSQFHGRPIFLRAGVLLPRDYEREPARRYPLWIRVGGLNSRFTAITNLMADGSEFVQTWLADGTPRFVLAQLDGAGPLGDPYQVNSANDGPYGDALTQELIPHIESTFRLLGQPRARVLSGTSTGGWVSLALQIFYPDFFNGAWSASPDPVDFRALQLVNIYEDDNAFVNHHGYERPSERDAHGDIVLTMRREVQMENLLGRGDSYAFSGEQWGAWNAVFGPRGVDGSPIALWDPQSGAINHAVADRWKKYDLRLVLEQNWKDLAPKLRGKLHIATGDADNYFLNNAVHLLEESLSHAEPPFEGKIVFGLGQGHGWFYLSLRQMLEEMQAATASN